MNQKIKDYLGVVVILALVGFVYAAISFVGSYDNASGLMGYRSFSVTGEGKVTAVPDVAIFTFSVIEQGGKDISKIKTASDKKTEKIVAGLKKDGIDAKDIKTTNYNIEPRYQYFNCGPVRMMSAVDSGAEIAPSACPPAEIVGYSITETFQVKIRDFAKVASTLSDTVANGANQVSQISFSIDDESALQAQAKGEAIKKAREEADIIAKAGGFRVGRLLSIEEGASNYPQMYASAKGSDAVGIGMMSAIAPSVATVEPGSQEVSSNVVLRYEIK